MTATTLIADAQSLPASGTRYLDLYLQDTKKLNLLIVVAYDGVEGDGATLKLFDGAGANDPVFHHPPDQGVPNVYGDGTDLTVVTFEAKGASYSFSTVSAVTFNQSISISIDRTQGQAYLRLRFINTDASNDATVTVYGVVA